MGEPPSVPVDRNTTIGVFFLAAGGVLAALGYVGAQSVPIAAFGFSLLVVGALILLLVPEPLPKDAYLALFEDSLTNIEIVLEESELREKALFVPIGDYEVRALIPISADRKNGSAPSLISNTSGSAFLEFAKRTPERFIENFGNTRALVLVPPGNKIVKEARIGREKEGVESGLRKALVAFSDIASSVQETKSEEGKIKIAIRNAKLNYDLPYFRDCLGSPVSCIACCVVAAVKELPVQIEEEFYDPALLRLTLRVFE
jgi:hypothetical protein